MRNKNQAHSGLGSVFNFVSLLFQLIPEAGCGQSPRSLVNAGFLGILMDINPRQKKSQRHKIIYTLAGYVTDFCSVLSEKYPAQSGKFIPAQFLTLSQRPVFSGSRQ